MGSDEVFSDDMFYFPRRVMCFSFSIKSSRGRGLKTVRENKHFVYETFVIKEVTVLSVSQVFKWVCFCMLATSVLNVKMLSQYSWGISFFKNLLLVHRMVYWTQYMFCFDIQLLTQFALQKRPLFSDCLVSNDFPSWSQQTAWHTSWLWHWHFHSSNSLCQQKCEAYSHVTVN